MYYYIYKITCTNGSFKNCFYIGQRTTPIKPELDKYKGSGRKIRDYYRKYPNDYIKEILCICDNKDELNQKEQYYIGLYINDDRCLNMAAGGCGGDVLQGMTEEEHKEFCSKVKQSFDNWTEEHRLEVNKTLSEAQKKRWQNASDEERKMYKSKMKEVNNRPEVKAKTTHYGKDNGMYGKRGKDNPNYGSKRSEETKRLQHERQANRRLMEFNGERFKIKFDEKDKYLAMGYKFVSKKLLYLNK